MIVGISLFGLGGVAAIALRGFSTSPGDAVMGQLIWYTFPQHYSSAFV